MHKLLLYTLILILPHIIYGQELTQSPPTFLVQNYSVTDYNASCLNREVAVSYWGSLYVANNSGLLSFDGNNWRLHRLPDKEGLFQLVFSNDTIYTKGEINCGYWVYDEKGCLNYHQLDEKPSHIHFRLPILSGPIPEEIKMYSPSCFAEVGPYNFIGTLKNGLYITDKEGKIIRHLDQFNLLTDNCIRDICVQDTDLVWLATDNGIAQIDINPPITLLGHRSKVGKLLEATLYQDSLYIQSNLGYFRKRLDPGATFEPISEEIGKSRISVNPNEENYTLQNLFQDPQSLGVFSQTESISRAYEDHFWLTANNQSGLFHVADGEGQIKCRILFNNYNLHLVTRGKRIIPLNRSLCAVSTMEGPMLININRLVQSGLGSLTMPKVRSIEYTDGNGDHALYPDTNQISLPHSFKEVRLNIGTTVFTPNHQISYKLEGISLDWSPWQKDGEISFLQLPTGKYKLHIRKYVVKGPFPELSILIEVRPPWYNTIWAYILYILATGFSGYLFLHYYTLSRQKKEKDRLEQIQMAEAQRMQQIKSEMLEAELQNKNNELTLQTSALVKRNQAIQSFLDELEKQKETLGDRYPNKLYNKLHLLMEEALENQSDWLQFETYFNSAHHNFMDRLRQQYSDITSGDLRICCLLRMNLSTKEIASLLNVSVRAVELRRYRLRKRLNLDSETNLVDFLMNF